MPIALGLPLKGTCHRRNVLAGMVNAHSDTVHCLGVSDALAFML